VDVSGIIFASVDCDADAVEDWNRWYDLEHLPPNIALPGIMSGRRYVAPPALHEVREPADRLEGFADGRGVHITVYTLNGDPGQVLADMTSMRDVLEDAGRMFAPEKKVVRFGDAMRSSWGVADPALKADVIDMPHMQHTSLRAVLRRGGDAAARDDVATAAVAVDGVHVVLGHRSITDDSLDLDLYLLEGDPIAVTRAARAAAPYGSDTEVLLDAPFRVIVPFDYGFADEIRGSSLPQKIDGSA
jgi:hypothetical protein